MFRIESISLVWLSGLHVIVGFTDKLRLMNILMDDMRVTKEFNIKSCQDCAFSTGGQYFAAVQSNTVYIFSTYTFENLGNLRAHNGKVCLLRKVYSKTLLFQYNSFHAFW